MKQLLVCVVLCSFASAAYAMTLTLIGPHARYTYDRLWFGMGIGWGTAFGFAGKDPYASLATIGIGASGRVGVELVRHSEGTLSAAIEATWTEFVEGPYPAPLSIVVGASYELR